jgi:uncharacterized protein (UPF0332 family)
MSELSKDGAIKKHKQALMNAEVLFNNEMYDVSANRSYYSMFYMAVATLKSFIGEDTSSKSHDSVMGMVNKELISTGILDKEIGKFIRQVELLRNRSDYSDESISREKALLALEKARLYSVEMNKIIDSGLTKSEGQQYGVIAKLDLLKSDGIKTEKPDDFYKDSSIDVDNNDDPQP